MEKAIKNLALVAVSVLVLGIASNAHAASMTAIDFGVIAPATGSVTYAGGANPLVGTNISVSIISGVNTPLNPTDPLDSSTAEKCVGCVLNFTTGNFASTSPGVAIFNGGGSISIVGGVDLTGDMDADDAGDIPINTTLLSGTFNSVTVSLTGNTIKIFIPLFGDTKDPKLIAYYGMPSGPYSGFANIGFTSTAANPPTAFSSTQILSGDIVNQPVNIPSSLLLMGSGLIGFVYLHVRQRRS